ncbi:MAG: phosphatidate cytidylyltransferase [Sedimentisphaerales bacterium]|nr:phosphatidate cytidylyltransferase [Sedimentisphaerales bacterium]
MLKQRLIFGTLMTLVFIGIVLLDGYLDGSLTASAGDDKPIRGTLLVILVAILMVFGLLELSKLASAKGAKILLPCSIPASVLLSTSSYWPFFPFTFYLFTLLLAFSVTACFLYQRIRYGVSGVLANCGAACFSMLYIGLLGGFVPAVRIDFGPWHLLMLIFVVKCSDIGAYTAGRLFGKHRFSPVISPGKTWEGMAGAVGAAVVVAVVFAVSCDIMTWWLGALFGVGFAFIGQMGDLAESMLKRDAEKKDASNNVPGFGGILDVVDSILITAPFGYLFFFIVN